MRGTNKITPILKKTTKPTKNCTVTFITSATCTGRLSRCDIQSEKIHIHLSWKSKSADLAQVGWRDQKKIIDV